MRPGAFSRSFALAAAPEPAVYANLLEAAQADYTADRLDDALTKLNQHDKARGRSGDSLDLRGSVALEQGKLAEARKSFDEAHKLQPELFAPRLHRAVAADDLIRQSEKYARSYLGSGTCSSWRSANSASFAAPLQAPA